MENRFEWVAVECGARRGGFYHYAKLLDTATGNTYDARINYVNRTWEPWPFYSVKREAVARARQAIEDAAVREALEQRPGNLPPVKRISKEFRRKAVEFYADGVALVALNGVPC